MYLEQSSDWWQWMDITPYSKYILDKFKSNVQSYLIRLLLLIRKHQNRTDEELYQEQEKYQFCYFLIAYSCLYLQSMVFLLSHLSILKVGLVKTNKTENVIHKSLPHIICSKMLTIKNGRGSQGWPLFVVESLGVPSGCLPCNTWHMAE